MQTLYRDEDIDAVSEKIDTIMKMADRKAVQTLDVTHKEYLIVFKHNKFFLHLK